MKKWIFAILVLGTLFGLFGFSLAQEDQVEINFFYSKTCPHCAQEEQFLDVLEEKYPQLKIKRFEIFKRESIELLNNFYLEYSVPPREQGLVPITFTEQRYFLGFNDQIAQEIESCIEECIINKEEREDIGKKFILPIIGQIDLTKHSLPTLTVVLGTLDGFNVCSLGALVLILGLVLALRSRKKTLIFGGIFILTTAIVYGFLIVLWYKIFSFLTPYLKILEILIGLLGIGGGFYFLHWFIKYRKQGPSCEIGTGKEIISNFSSKLQEVLAESKKVLLALGLVFLFATVITIVEFPCSALVPVAFAGILAGAKLPSFLYLLYIAIFVLFYMLDEIIVFLIAFFAMKIWLASSRAITWITLLEAIIFFGLGLYYLL